jgi:hypothetical protein
VDDLISSKGQLGALVSRDGVFQHPKIIEFTNTAGVQLQVFSSVRAVFDAVISEAVQSVKQVWDTASAEVKHSLESRIAEVEEFTRARLEIPPWNFVIGARVVAVPEIKALDVQGVTYRTHWKSGDWTVSVFRSTCG